MDPKLLNAIQQINAQQEEVNKISAEIQTQLAKQQSLQAQKNENENVKLEFDIVDESSGVEVYKLIGPVLVKQDFSEAKSNVDKRLEFIKKEVENTDKKIEELLQKKQTLEKSMVDISNWVQQRVAQIQQLQKK
ncbi:hypothetical protein FDP41_009310 [Naegleria fowleri]|uniref:Prefoldin subunit 6 n=1 Tax=Naegleria fowleri TaxID=5763 RepID=A0A6A5B2D6_NAEFO|nr:uncharacterized protein FDP41_009310 [Naegleria fowleri]KAF0972407.1 hypothetical protein FDP41_009310 [Naegleria fowleri]CAG4711919.1 unnamed protein product [Naegleria fowleri]